jgi:hypothetical protein
MHVGVNYSDVPQLHRWHSKSNGKVAARTLIHRCPHKSNKKYLKNPPFLAVSARHLGSQAK